MQAIANQGTLTDQVDRLFAEWDQPTSPGCALAILQNGEVVYQRGYGMADLEHAIPISPISVFDIGSTSKQFTALCVALLARQGHLSLDDPIQKYLPKLPEYERRITIRHLIHHTSGLRDYLSLMLLKGMRWENNYPEEQLLDLIACQQALNFQPGSDFLYSNTGYLLLGMIVKRASGKSLREYAEEQIFIPLGMHDTHFYDDSTRLVPNRAIGYALAGEGEFRLEISLFDVVGDGGLYTTVADLCCWDHNFYANHIGGYGQDLIEELITVGKLNSGESLDYGFGLMVQSFRGLQTIQHSGSWAGFRAEYMRFADEKFSVICLANLNMINPTGLAHQVAALYLRHKMNEPVTTATPTDRWDAANLSLHQTRAGFYHDKQGGSIWELTAYEEGLQVDTGLFRFSLVAHAPTHYRAEGAPIEIEVEFEEQSADQPMLLHARPMGGRPAQFRRLVPIDHSEVELSGYVGDYLSPELRVSYNLRIEEWKLVLNREYQPRVPLQLATHDLVTGAGMVLQFVRNSEGHVCGLSLTAYRTKEIQFTVC